MAQATGHAVYYKRFWAPMALARIDGVSRRDEFFASSAGEGVLDIKSIHILVPKTRNHEPHHPSNGQKCSLAILFRHVLPMVRDSAWFQEFERGPYRLCADSGPRPFEPNGLEINPDPFQPNGLDTKRSCDHPTNDWNEHREQLSGGHQSDCKQQ